MVPVHIASFSVSALICVVWQVLKGSLDEEAPDKYFFLVWGLASLTLPKKKFSALSYTVWESPDLLSTLLLF